MFFQKVLKGISNISKQEAEKIVLYEGIHSNFWRAKKVITNTEVKDELTEMNLLHHLNDYEKPLPSGHKWEDYGKTYGDMSIFISTTAGAIQRDDYISKNVLFAPYITALNFATNFFEDDGYLFYAYVMTLGKKSIALASFSEEVRELHIYTDFLPFHHEGEITAKVSIPSVFIEKAEYYIGIDALQELDQGRLPMPVYTINNPNYADPDDYNNIRELL